MSHLVRLDVQKSIASRLSTIVQDMTISVMDSQIHAESTVDVLIVGAVRQPGTRSR